MGVSSLNKDEDGMVWNNIKIRLSKEGGMCWLRNVAKENMILINYHKMSPNEQVDTPKEMDALMILMKAAIRSGFELKTSNTIEGAKKV